MSVAIRPSLLSVVIPCFNEQEVILETIRRLSEELEKIGSRYSLDWEAIFVDDGSRDRTLELLGQACAKDPEHLKVLALSRNFGHQIALSAGLDHARGQAIVAIDADLQDPVELIGAMVEQWRQGAQVAYGVRTSRDGETWFKLWTAKIFYRTLKRMTGVEIPMDTGDFRLIDRTVLEVFKSMPERSRFIRGMIPWIGLDQRPVPYERAARFAGETKYPFRRMARLAIDALTSFSTAPLRLAYFAGLIIAALSFLWAAYIIVRTSYFDSPVAGWSSVMVAVLFLGGVQLITVGVLGEYIGRIYEQVKSRPLYVVNAHKSIGIQP